MHRQGLIILALLLVGACSATPTGGDGGKGGGAGGGTGGGVALDPFGVTVLDPNAKEATFLAMAVDPVKERVGVAYYSPRGTETNSGHPDYDLKYVEWSQGVTSAVETVGLMVQRRVGLSLAFDPLSGAPVIGLLGGGSGFVAGQSVFWFQSDAALRRRSGATWTETLVATTGDQAPCGNTVSDRGFLVGLWPSVLFDPAGKLYFAWRDGHDGQFDKQDWDGSDVELADFQGAATPALKCVNAGGDNKQAWGGHLQLAMGANTQPAMVYDQMPLGADTAGQNVVFQQRKADGSWSNPAIVVTIGNTQTGPSLAYDATEGYGIAVLERATNRLMYVKSIAGASWLAPDEVIGEGTSGWYPSLAMDPINHEPAIAYYFCSPRAGVNADSCLADDDELRVVQRVGGNWRGVVVDAEGGYAPMLAFFASGKRVVAYRDPRSGVVKLAVER